MPEWLAIILVTAFIAAITGIIGFYFRSLVQEQKTLITAINNLTIALVKVETKVDAFNVNLLSTEKSLDELGDHVDAINYRLITLEKEHESRTKEPKNTHDTCCG